ncbi:peptidase family M3 [Penicillium angulare]|uniref:Peptidase family M3 n=1 Tax=Penicillium angulare TaxID=116970 RepID=A0A9W9K6L4_9EURO|nr:peptidase family M3 [Penicillium angulare]
MSLPQSLQIVPAAEEVVPTMTRIIDEEDFVRKQILQTVIPTNATFQNVILPLAEVQNKTQGERSMLDMLQYGSPSLASQNAFDQARRLDLEAEMLRITDRSFFKLLQTAKQNSGGLDIESEHLIDKELLKYTHAGYGILTDKEMEQYQLLKAKIADLERAFQQNVAREAGGVHFTIDELTGVPGDQLSRWKDSCSTNEAIHNQHQKWKLVPFANGGTQAVLTYAHSPDTRKKMYLEDNRKLGENKSIFEEIVKVRTQKAHLLKYETHADFRIETRMAKSVEWVNDFLEGLREPLCRYGRDEIAVLQKRREKDTDAQVGKAFPPWDKFYYERLVKEEFHIDQQLFSEYFPLQETANRMLGIFSSFFDLRFDLIPADNVPSDCVWHDTVRIFSVWDIKNDNQFVGYIYFDLLWRENKYRGNQCVNIQCGYLKPDETRQYPATILMCSFPASTPERCTLLQHHQVVTLFHELGHGIHDLLARTKYVRFHGYRLPPDFGEMPSTLLENWCWMEDVLEKLSCHYTTLDTKYLTQWQTQHPLAGEPDPAQKVPRDLVKNLIKHRYFGKGLYYLRQLVISIFDLQIHSIRPDHVFGNLDIQKVWYDLREDIEGMDFSECRDGFSFATFTHLTAGYDVCYYSYLCCTAMAQDIFSSRFESDPHNKDTWDKYRRDILQYGGSQIDLLGMLEAFLGRPPNMNALVEGLLRVKRDG